MALRSQSCCKINTERLGADLLILLTPLTLRNASVTNEKLDKITTSRRGFQKATTYITDPVS